MDNRHFISHRFFIFLLGFIFSSFYTLAQNVTLKGSVKDANGQPVAGASVILEGTKKGTSTDGEGNYKLLVPQAPAGTHHTLLISYVGMQTQKLDITISSEDVITNDFQMVNTGVLTAITVGSRSSTIRTRIQTPVPVDVIPVSQVINEIGQVDLNQILTYIAPSFQSARQTIADGTDHVDPAQLRGLGTDQVLVLVNGKRRHQSALVNVNGTVNRGQVSTDLSAIPATAIERIEILRDGAAAQYGSDAIAGVINIILKKKTALLEAGVSYGEYITKYDKNYAIFKLAGKEAPLVKARDGENFQASLGYGFNIGKGFLNLTGEYIRREPTNRAGTYTGRIYPLVNGANRDDSILQARNLDRNYFDFHIGNSKMKGGNIFYNFGYPLSDKTELYLFGGYGKKKGTSAGFYRYPDGSTSILSGAKKYTPNVLAIYPNGFLPQINSDLLDFSTAIGLTTKFNGWNFDISNTFGTNKFDFTIDQSVNYTQFFLAGNKQTSFDAGGLKFWQNTVNADISKKYDVLKGLNVAAGLEYRIDAFGIRSGEEASYKNYDTASKALAGSQVFAGLRNLIGDTKTRNSKAVYIDLEQDITEKFLVTGALRFENYSDFGSTLNYKFSSRYKFCEAFTIRGSLSTGFRAPSMQQRFFSKTSTIFQSQGGTLVQVESGTFTNDSKAAQILGIPKLKEETSHNYSVGFTAKPLRGLELTVDAYQVNIKDRIILTNDFTGFTDPALRDQLAAAGASTANFFTNAVDTKSKGLETVISYNKNFAKTQSIRIILAMTFIENEVEKGANGKPIIHASPTLLANGQLGKYFNREDQSRIEVANPKNKVSLAFNYKVTKLGVMLRFVRFGQVQYIDPGIDPANPAAFPINTFNNNIRESTDQLFSPKTVTDISLSYQITSQLSFTIGANNLFDVYQDRHYHSSNYSNGRFVYSRRVQQMGFNGAYYFARLKLALATK